MYLCKIVLTVQLVRGEYVSLRRAPEGGQLFTYGTASDVGQGVSLNLPAVTRPVELKVDAPRFN